jgi:hypothetical protein
MGSGSTILLNAAAMNEAKHTVSDHQAAEKARTMQRRIGRPSTQRHMELISKGRIRNCAITRQDIINAEDIFGPDLGSLKGKTGRTQGIGPGTVWWPSANPGHYHGPQQKNRAMR